MHKIKKIFIYLSIIIGFIFCFFNANKINILAIDFVDNTLGSYPLALDIDNYNTNNYLNIKNYNYSLYGVNYVFNDNYFTITGSRNSTANSYAYVDIENYTLNGNYTIYRSATWQGNVAIRDANNNDLCSLSWGAQKKTCNINATIDKLYLDVTGIAQNTNININGFLMLYSGNLEPTSYYSPFKFGFEMDIVYNQPNGLSIGNVIVKLNNNICSNTPVAFAYDPDNTSQRYIQKNVCFIPFNINSFGYISLQETIINTVFDSNNLILNGQSGYILRPVLYGYYKGEYANNILYLKNSYTLNSVMLTGISSKVYSNTSLDNNLMNTISIAFNDNLGKGTDAIGLTNNIQSLNVVSDYTSNVSLLDRINMNEYLSTNIALTFGNFTNASDINNLNYSISLSSINSLIRNNISGTPPISNNSNLNNKFKECSAWYDIPCQLGNALTYVIYEAPIISPIINFFDNFIDIMSNLVTYITWFEGLGIIFSVFIFILMIRMIILLAKGGNDD